MLDNNQSGTQNGTKVIGVLFGRFQPFHLSHLEGIKRYSEKVDEIIILVSDFPLLKYRHSPKLLSAKENPFSYDERREMIEKALVNEAGMGTDRFSVRPFLGYLLDMHRGDGDLNVYLIADHGKLSKYLKAAFRRSGRVAKSCSNGAETGVHATEIRSLIRDGKDWEGLVPQSTAAVVHRKAGVLVQ